MKKDLLKYVIIAVIACVIFVCGWALLDMWVKGDSFADGFKGVLDWLLGVVFGVSCAWTCYKNDQKKDKNNR